MFSKKEVGVVKMSYNFGLFFKQVEDKTAAFELALRAVDSYYKNASDVLGKRHFNIPSVYFGEKDPYTDKLWLNDIFTLRFIYWEKEKLLGLIGYDYPKEVENLFDCHVDFQNSCDQDYDFDEWDDKIDIFKRLKPVYKAISIEELISMNSQEGYNIDEVKEELKSDLDYHRRTAMYQAVYEALHLNNWLWDNEDNYFQRFSLNALNSQEKQSKIYLNMLKQLKK